jgi:hypothetical protein
LALRDVEWESSDASNKTESPQWYVPCDFGVHDYCEVLSNSPCRHITAEDVDPALNTYHLQTQQDPFDAIDLVGWSKQIILG